MILSLIAAMDRNGVIGTYEGHLPWPPNKRDMIRFRRTTMGCPVIMGRCTWNGLPGPKPLPGRLNIVLSGDTEFRNAMLQDAKATPLGFPCFAPAYHLADALMIAHASLWEKEPDSHEAFVIGGGLTYEKALPLVTRAYLTVFDAEYPGDVRFPGGLGRFDQGWRLTQDDRFAADALSEVPMRFLTYEKETR